jgi:hypothetical protein
MGWQRSLIHCSLVSLKPPLYGVVFFCLLLYPFLSVTQDYIATYIFECYEVFLT